MEPVLEGVEEVEEGKEGETNAAKTKEEDTGGAQEEGGPEEGAVEAAADKASQEEGEVVKETPVDEQNENAEPQETTKANNSSSAPRFSRVDSYFTVDDKTRHFIHSKLRAYESRRRSTYTGKLESSSLYWRSFRDLLNTSLHETARAERLVLGTARANAIYSDSMLASYEDNLVDDKGGMVTDPKKRSKLLEVRSTQDYPVAPLSPMSGDTPARRRNSSMTEERKDNMLSSLINSQAILADKFGNNSKALETEIASELTQLRMELESKTGTIQEIGDAIIAELETTELEVTKAWGEYMLNL